MAVADVFDALTSNRCYKKAFSFDESYNIIVNGSGINFDPLIVQSFSSDVVKEKIKKFKKKIV